MRTQLPGGAQLVMLPKATRGTAVHAGIRLNMGDEQSLLGVGRLGNLIPQMLMRGTASKSRQQIQDELGSNFQAQVEEDGARFLVTAIAAPQNAARVEASFRDELAAILRDGYSEEEVAAAKQAGRRGGKSGARRISS